MINYCSRLNSSHDNMRQVFYVDCVILGLYIFTKRDNFDKVCMIQPVPSKWLACSSCAKDVPQVSVHRLKWVSAGLR